MIINMRNCTSFLGRKSDFGVNKQTFRGIDFPVQQICASASAETSGFDVKRLRDRSVGESQNKHTLPACKQGNAREVYKWVMIHYVKYRSVNGYL